MAATRPPITQFPPVKAQDGDDVDNDSHRIINRLGRVIRGAARAPHSTLMSQSTKRIGGRLTPKKAAPEDVACVLRSGLGEKDFEKATSGLWLLWWLFETLWVLFGGMTFLEGTAIGWSERMVDTCVVRLIKFVKIRGLLDFNFKTEGHIVITSHMFKTTASDG